ncbi:hypothetical protein [Aeromicrobium sp.]
MQVVRVGPDDVSRAAPLFAAYREFYGEPFDHGLARDWLAQRIERGESIELATAHTNHRAQSVYDRHGYHADEHYKHYEKPLP